jgi:hypothetical protein
MERDTSAGTNPTIYQIYEKGPKVATSYQPGLLQVRANTGATCFMMSRLARRDDRESHARAVEDVHAFTRRVFSNYLCIEVV